MRPPGGSQQMAAGKYRPDVDGLRAVAIVPVVLYHVDVPYFGGGFVGVDIFYVVSGYLITRIIVDELKRETRSRSSISTNVGFAEYTRRSSS